MGSLSRENLQRHLSRHSSKEEISESKQMLFNKHLGQEDLSIEAVLDYMKELKELSASALVHDTTSDGCDVSSNYPNSSFSTFRENTFGSFSSAMAVKEDDPEQRLPLPEEDLESVSTSMESSGQEAATNTTSTNAETGIKEVINQTQEIIDQMATLKLSNNEEKKEEPMVEEGEHKRPVKTWGQANISNVERKFMLQQKRMQEYFKNKDTDRWQQSLSTETDMSSACYHCQDNKDGEPAPVEVTKPPTPKIRKEKSLEKLVKSDIAKDLEPKKLVIPMQEVLRRPAPRPVTAPIFKRPSFVRDKESVASSIQSHVSGVYTNEYLTRARKFGAVVGALRKPGHHIGPAKNPDCVCEHCTRWFEEKCKGRGRANSITNAPLTFEGFRVRRLQQ